MRRKSIILPFILILALMLTACGESGSGHHEELVMEDPIKVELTLSSDSAAAGDKISMKAKVTQSGNPVEDAEKVEFELRLEGGENETIPVQHAGNGIYELEKVMKVPGKYKVISHVTARGQHSMPMKELNITR